MCKKGFLFNRPSLLRALAKNNLPKRLNYITTPEDLCEVNLNPNKKNRFPFCCPLTAKVLNGLNPFVLIWSCGCLMYEKLLFPLAGIKVKLETILQHKETGEGGKQFVEKRYKCPNCRTGFALENLFCLNLSTKKSSNSLSSKKEKVNVQNNVLGKREEMEPSFKSPVNIKINISTKRIKRNENNDQNKVTKSQKSKKASENKKK
jgi:hypothetical protein